MKTQEEKFSDLTKRLRNKANTLCDEAANEIEALKAEVVKLSTEQLDLIEGHMRIEVQQNADYAEACDDAMTAARNGRIRAEKAEAERDRFRDSNGLLIEALESIGEYWNGGSESAVDACEHAVEISADAIKTNTIRNDVLNREEG